MLLCLGYQLGRSVLRRMRGVSENDLVMASDHKLGGRRPMFIHSGLICLDLNSTQRWIQILPIGTFLSYVQHRILRRFSGMTSKTIQDLSGILLCVHYHAIVSFAGLGFLSFYLAGKLHLGDSRGHRVRLKDLSLLTPVLR